MKMLQKLPKLKGKPYPTLLFLRPCRLKMFRRILENTLNHSKVMRQQKSESHASDK